MAETESKSNIRFGLRSVGLPVVFLAAMSLLACIAAIPIAVHYFQTEKNYVAEADARKGADEIWPAIVRLGEKAEADGRGEILERNDTERLLKITNRVQTAEVKVISLGKRKSRVTIMASVPKGEDSEIERAKELSMSMMNGLCEEAKAGCKFVEE
jgi:hypothetical protein